MLDPYWVEFARVAFSQTIATLIADREVRFTASNHDAINGALYNFIIEHQLFIIQIPYYTLVPAYQASREMGVMASYSTLPLHTPAPIIGHCHQFAININGPLPVINSSDGIITLK